MRAHGWAVLEYQALADVDPLPELLARLPDALGTQWTGRGWRALHRELTVQINAAVVKIEARVRVRAEPESTAQTSVYPGTSAGRRRPAGSQTAREPADHDR
jgi:hypothetical protein